MHDRAIVARLTAITAAVAIWMMLTSIMGASAYSFDTEHSACALSGFTSQSWVQTTRDDFALGQADSVDVDSRPGEVVLEGRTECLFAFRGAGSRSFWKYEPGTASWVTLANAPASLRDEGGALASDGHRYVYAIHGGNRQFWRYDIDSNSWSTLPRTPAAVRLGGGLTYDGSGNLYTLQGASNNGFWRFNVTTNSWSVMARTPGQVSDGGCLVSDRVGFIYAFQGNGQSNFWRYDVAADSWAVLAQAPYSVRYGGAMTYDGQDSIFAVPGWSQAHFLRYSIPEDRWYTLTSVPAPIGSGGSLAFCQPATVCLLTGLNTPHFYVYDIDGDSWAAATSTPRAVSAGGALAAGPMAHSAHGSLTSMVLDTGITSERLQGVFWDEAIPPGTSMTLEIRASNILGADGPDSAWVSLDGGTSPPPLPSGRYLQWRATLSTSNHHVTPSLQEVRVYHG